MMRFELQAGTAPVPPGSLAFSSLRGSDSSHSVGQSPTLTEFGPNTIFTLLQSETRMQRIRANILSDGTMKWETPLPSHQRAEAFFDYLAGLLRPKATLTAHRRPRTLR